MTLKPPGKFQDPAPIHQLLELFDESARSLAIWQRQILPGLHFPSSGHVQYRVLLRGASKAWLHRAASDDDLSCDRHSAAFTDLDHRFMKWKTRGNIE